MQRSVLSFETTVKKEQHETGLFYSPRNLLTTNAKSYCAFLLKPKYTEDIAQHLSNYEQLHPDYLRQMSQKMLEFLVFIMQNSLSELSFFLLFIWVSAQEVLSLGGLRQKRYYWEQKQLSRPRMLHGSQWLNSSSKGVRQKNYTKCYTNKKPFYILFYHKLSWLQKSPS